MILMIYIHTKLLQLKYFLEQRFLDRRENKETLTCLFFLIFQAPAKIRMPLRDRGDTQTSLASNVLAKTKYPATDDTAGISENRKYA